MSHKYEQGGDRWNWWEETQYKHPEEWPREPTPEELDYPEKDEWVKVGSGMYVPSTGSGVGDGDFIVVLKDEAVVNLRDCL